MTKTRSRLPILKITDGENEGTRRFVSLAYVRTTLQTIQIMALQGGDVAGEVKGLIEEIDATYED